MWERECVLTVLNQTKENRGPLSTSVSEGGWLSGQKKTYLLDTHSYTHTHKHRDIHTHSTRNLGSAEGYVLMPLNCPSLTLNRWWWCKLHCVLPLLAVFAGTNNGNCTRSEAHSLCFENCFFHSCYQMFSALPLLFILGELIYQQLWQ